MSTRVVPLLVACLALTACMYAPPPAGSGIAVRQVPYTPDSGTVAVRCGLLIDGVRMLALIDTLVIIRDGRIKTVRANVSQGDLKAVHMPLLDLSEHTCLPGLIDMHTHLADGDGDDTADLSVYYHRTLADQLPYGRKNARVTLDAGFTSVRDVGTYIAWTDRALRDEINSGQTAGPRMQVAGYYLTIPGGGGDLVIPGHAESEIPDYIRRGVARGADDFRRKAQAAVDGGADLLKVIASGAVLAYGGVPGEPEMTPDEIKAVVDVAHHAGIKVAAHAHGAQSIKDAILAGVDTIEHASLIDDEGIALAREHQVALSMDVYNGDYIDTEGRKQNWPEEFLRKNVETTEIQRQAFTKAVKAGVPIVYATDAGVFPHGLNARQFRVMVKRGMNPMQAIQSATSVAAHYLGNEADVGTLEAGKFGDLIAVRGDPLIDITVLENVDVVIKGGILLKLPPPELN